MGDVKTIDLATRICVRVEYVKVAEHGTRQFIVHAKAEEDDLYIEVGNFYVDEDDRVTYVSKPDCLLPSFFTRKLKSLISMNYLLSLTK